MAEIPVERKPTPWWIWALLSLLLLLFLLWIAGVLNGDEEPATSAAIPSAASGDSAEPITDFTLVIAVPDRRSLVGRTVELADAPVLDVVGDRAFWIGSSAEQRLFVVLKEVPPPGSPTDADIDINPGQTVNLRGVVRAMPDARTATAAFGEAGAVAAENEQIYLFAETAEIVARP